MKINHRLRPSSQQQLQHASINSHGRYFHRPGSLSQGRSRDVIKQPSYQSRQKEHDNENVTGNRQPNELFKSLKKHPRLSTQLNTISSTDLVEMKARLFSRPDWKDPASLGLTADLFQCIIDFLTLHVASALAACNRVLYNSPLLPE